MTVDLSKTPVTERADDVLLAALYRAVEAGTMTVYTPEQHTRVYNITVEDVPASAQGPTAERMVTMYASDCGLDPEDISLTVEVLTDDDEVMVTLTAPKNLHQMMALRHEWFDDLTDEWVTKTRSFFG